jgi:hypothetical protein
LEWSNTEGEDSVKKENQCNERIAGGVLASFVVRSDGADGTAPDETDG